MANKKISELVDASPLDGSEQIEVRRAGSNLRTTAQAIADLAATGSGVESIVAGTNITVDDTDPANPIVSASTFPYPDPGHLWFAPSGVTLVSESGQISNDAFVVRDPDVAQWVMFYSKTAASPIWGKSYYITAPTLLGPWSAETEIVPMRGYVKVALLVDELGVTAKVGGLYHSYVVSYAGSPAGLEIYHFTAATLTGTWSLVSKVLALGASGSLDEYSLNAPFAMLQDGSVYIWYMGAPASSQPTYGLAIRKLRAVGTAPGGPFTKNYTDVIAPSTTSGDWDYGWMGGTQILKRPDGTYLHIYNAGHDRPSSPGVETNGSRIGYAYGPSIDGPWTKYRANPVVNYEGAPSTFPDSYNIWRFNIAYDQELLKWVMFYNTGYGQEVITYALEGVYSFDDLSNSPGYVFMTGLTTSLTTVLNSRVNLIPGVYRARCQVGISGDAATGTTPHLAIDFLCRLDNVQQGLACNAYVANYAWENDEYECEKILRVTETGYVDWAVQVVEGTPTAGTDLKRLRVIVERL